MATVRQTLLQIFDDAVASVVPARCIPTHIPNRVAGRTWVAGAGKAAAQMAQALAAADPGPLGGLVVTRYGHGLADGMRIPGVEVVEAGHPLPDRAGLDAAQRILKIARSAERGDQLIFLASGGGSALLVSPPPGLTLADKQAVNWQLLAAGAGIHEINCVRKHLSAIKGGRLTLAAQPAVVTVLAISDVPGDDIADIASGPCSPDPSSLDDARIILDQYGCDVPDHVRDWLADAANETPKPGDRGFESLTERLIARSSDAITAAMKAAASAGYEPILLGDALEGSADALGAEHARAALDYAAGQGRHALISGGETTVAVRNPDGRGGRNTQYLLALALALGEAPGVWALAADTDGIDGTEDNAGAVITPDTLARSRAAGQDAESMLGANRAYDFFESVGDLIVTGPTGTNVNDLRVILVDSESGRINVG